MWARICTVLILLFSCCVANAQGRVSVRGYTRKDGTYVRPHTRSYPGGGSGGFSGGFNSGPALGAWNNYGVPRYVPKPIDTEARRAARMQGMVFVRGYQRADGTWVDAHFRTYPDGIEWNNLSARKRSGGSSVEFREPNDFVYPNFTRSRLHEQQLKSKLVAQGVDSSKLGFGYTKHGKIDGYFVDDDFHLLEPDAPEVKWPAADYSDEEKARGLLRMAKTLVGQKGKEVVAMQWLQKVIDKYPDTAAAHEAASLQAESLKLNPWLEQFRASWQPAGKAA